MSSLLSPKDHLGQAKSTCALEAASSFGSALDAVLNSSRHAGHRLSDLRILTTDASMSDTLATCAEFGLTAGSVVGVDADSSGLMSATALRHTLSVLQFADHIPVAVVTPIGHAHDAETRQNLALLAAICSLHHLWLHVEAPPGALTAPRRCAFDGLGCADSVTFGTDCRSGSMAS